MEETGAALGATSLFLQVFQGCVGAFSFWSKGDAISEEASLFQVRLEGQAAKFKAWGVQWGMDLGVNHPILMEDRFKEQEGLATKYVVMIHHFLDALQDLESEFPIIASVRDKPPTTTTLLARARALQHVESSPGKPFVENLAKLDAETSLKERFKWAAQDGGPLKTLELLRGLIQDLYDIFPPPKKDPVAEHVLNALLASLDRTKLQTLTETSTENPTLRGLAHLKSMILQMEARTIVLREGRVWEKLSLLTDVSDNDVKQRRSVAKFRGQPALVEWKHVHSGSDPTHQIMVKERIENLARLLKAKHKPEDLQTLECLGVVKQPGASDNEMYYGIVFATPLTIQCSLHDLLRNGNSNRDAGLALGHWFTITKHFVKTVLFLHLAGWVHKAIRSENVLFLGNNSAESHANLRLAGFEYSRKAASAEQTEGVGDDLELNLYRHPEVQGGLGQKGGVRVSYGIDHDIYSMGVVLLEIGLRQTALKLLDVAKGQAGYEHTALAFRRFLLGDQVPRLEGAMGTSYMEVTRRCLDGSLKDENDSSLQEALYLKVLRPLQQYQVL